MHPHQAAGGRGIALRDGAHDGAMVVDGDPLADLSCFWSDGGQGSRLAVVMKEGRVYADRREGRRKADPLRIS